MVNPNATPTAANLRDVQLLKVFTEQELQELIRFGKVETAEPYANIVIEGEMSWGVYLILEGTVGILKNQKVGNKVYDVGQLKEGSFFGEMSLVDESPRSATVRALTECRFFYISKEDFFRFLSKSSERMIKFYQSCVKTLSSRLRELDEHYVVSQYQLWETALRKDKKQEAA